VASSKMTFEGVYGGPCPVCAGMGELLGQDSVFGGYRTLRHLDDSGHEQVCTLPEAEGMLYTKGGRWWYVPVDGGADVQ